MAEKENGNESNLSTWSLDREIVLARVINSPRELVFAAWTDPKHLPEWFGPSGFKIVTKEIEIKVGGRWRFDMIALDGTIYSSRMTFKKIEKPLLLEMNHGSDIDNDPGMFRMTITFDEQSNGKTVVTLRQIHPSKANRDAGVGFCAVEYGYQTLDKLARHVESGGVQTAN